jgi:hypothetical protein
MSPYPGQPPNSILSFIEFLVVDDLTANDVVVALRALLPPRLTVNVDDIIAESCFVIIFIVFEALLGHYRVNRVQHIGEALWEGWMRISGASCMTVELLVSLAKNA